MTEILRTERLIIQPIGIADAAFIYTLVNTDAWKRYIGDRHVDTLDDAISYIARVMENPATNFKVVRRLEDECRIGIVTLIKRAYLPHHDIGFAFLPQYAGKGYAYEAAYALLEDVRNDAAHTHILATTIPGNERSIHLLEKLGLKFRDKLSLNGEQLLLYRRRF